MPNNFKYIIFILCIFSFTQLYSQESSDDKKAKLAMNTFLDAEKNKMLDNYSEATKLYQKTIEIDSTYDPAMFELGRIYAIQQKLPESLFWIEKAYKLDETNKWYALLLIDLYRSSYQINKAILVTEKLIETEPNNTEYLLSVSGLYTAAEQYENAVEALNKIEAIDGISENIILQKRNIYLKQNNYEKAIESLKKLNQTFPKEEKYCSMIAELYMKQEKPEAALEWYNKVLEINPENPYIQITLADYYGKNGETDKAYQYLKEGYSNPNLDIDTKVQVLVSYFEQMEQQTIIKERAYELAEILVNTHSDNPKSHAIYGDLLITDSLYKEASSQFIEVIKLDSTRYPVWQQLLYSLSMENENEKMESYSSKAIELFPQMDFPYYVNAIANFQLEKPEKVIEIVEQGLYFVSNPALSEQFYMFLGDAYHQTNNNEKAFENYEKCLEINPKNGFVLNNYAYYLSLENRSLDKAEEMAKRSVDIDPNENNLDTYGWVLYQVGKYEEALNFIQQSIEMSDKPSAVVLEHLGDVYFKLGETKKAKSQWKKAIKAGGDKEVLEEKMNNND